MVLRESYAVQKQRDVIRCDKCCMRLEGKARNNMEILTFHTFTAGKVTALKYHLCWQCAFNLRDDMNQRRERILTGVTDAEQEALLKGLFRKKR